MPDMSLERCGVKAQICNDRLYLIGGGNRNTGPFMLNDFNEYYDLKAKKWEKFQTGPLKGYNFALILTNKPGQLIVYGGSDDPAYDNQFKKFYMFDCKTNQATLLGEVKEVGKLDFDFDNTAIINQTLLRSMKGNRQEHVLLRFKDNGTYDFIKKDVL